MIDLVWGFAPWIAFLLTVRMADVYWAAAVGLVVGVIVLIRAALKKKIHLFDVVGTVYFAGMLAILWAIRPSNLDAWGRYAQAVAHGSLTVIVFGSILINHPFTESYAREKVPRQYWKSPEFRATNRRISAVWGLAFLVGTISMIIAGAVDERTFLLRIVIPFGALGSAYLYTQHVSESSSHHASGSEGACVATSDVSGPQSGPPGHGQAAG